MPAEPDTIAARIHAKIAGAPRAHRSDDVPFAVHVEREGIPEAGRPARREASFAKKRPCPRTSPLVRAHGRAIHHDAAGRVALADPASPRFAELAADPAVARRPGLRSDRARPRRD